MKDSDATQQWLPQVFGGIVAARHAHALRRVPIVWSTLVRIQCGHKLIEWDGGRTRADPGQLVFMPAGMALDVANIPGHGGYSADLVCFRAEVMREFRNRHRQLLLPQAEAPAPESLLVPMSAQITQAWDTLMQCLETAPDALQLHHAEGLLLSLALTGRAGLFLLDRNDPISARVQQLVMLAPAANWTVASLAGRLNVGASTLRRQLAREGRGIRDILEEVRLGLALHSLQSTAASIGDIAAASGYTSPSRFALRFRERYGMSPRDLRALL